MRIIRGRACRWDSVVIDINNLGGPWLMQISLGSSRTLHVPYEPIGWSFLTLGIRIGLLNPMYISLGIGAPVGRSDASHPA